MSEPVIAPMQPSDWAAVRAIYAEGLATGIAAFLLQPPLWESWDARHVANGRLVCRLDGVVQGWAALSPVADT